MADVARRRLPAIGHVRPGGAEQRHPEVGALLLLASVELEVPDHVDQPADRDCALDIAAHPEDVVGHATEHQASSSVGTISAGAISAGAMNCARTDSGTVRAQFIAPPGLVIAPPGSWAQDHPHSAGVPGPRCLC